MNNSHSQNRNQERRKVPRIPMGVTIFIPHLQTKLICHNLSETGCFFPAVDLDLAGETLTLLIDPPDTGIISVEARIIHKGEDGKGSGFQFIFTDPEDKRKLASFLDIFIP